MFQVKVSIKQQLLNNISFIQAAEVLSSECVQELLNYEGDVYCKNIYGFTIHMQLIRRGGDDAADILELLLKNTNKTFIEQEGAQWLHTAINKKSPECIRILIKFGVDVDVENDFGQ